jgi:hypothetical protein
MVEGVTSSDAPTRALWQLSDEELTTALVAGERTLRQGYAELIAIVGEIEHRGLGTTLGYKDSVAFVSAAARVSLREAKARVELAEATMLGRWVSAETAPRLPHLAEALPELNREHLAELSRVLAALPTWISADDFAEAESMLVELARVAGPESLRKAGRHLLAYFDQEKPPHDEELASPKREFRYRFDRRGWMHFAGTADPETAALLEGLFGVLAKPSAADATGEPDDRTTSRRRGDALAEIVDLAARADDLPVQGGERAVVTVTVRHDELRDQTGKAVVDGPGYGSISQARRWCCDAKILPAVLGSAGEVLDLGRAGRFATPAQRRALALRDGGCAFPGCTRPPKWCTPHHVRHWIDGGRTDLANLVLLCARHHRELHHTDWEVRMCDGIPEFIPPAWLDPDRRPLQNTVHPRLNGPPGERRAA